MAGQTAAGTGSQSAVNGGAVDGGGGMGGDGRQGGVDRNHERHGAPQRAAAARVFEQLKPRLLEAPTLLEPPPPSGGLQMRRAPLLLQSVREFVFVERSGSDPLVDVSDLDPEPEPELEPEPEAEPEPEPEAPPPPLLLVDTNIAPSTRFVSFQGTSNLFKIRYVDAPSAHMEAVSAMLTEREGKEIYLDVWRQTTPPTKIETYSFIWAGNIDGSVSAKYVFRDAETNKDIILDGEAGSFKYEYSHINGHGNYVKSVFDVWKGEASMNLWHYTPAALGAGLRLYPINYSGYLNKYLEKFHQWKLRVEPEP